MSQYELIRPISQDISQASYVELISVIEKARLAIPPRTQVDNAVRSLAFRKVQPTPYRIAAAEPQSQRNISDELRNIVTPFSEITDTPCLVSNIVCDPTSTDCPVDIAYVLDDSGSMEVALKPSYDLFEEVSRYTQQISPTNHRLSLTTFRNSCASIKNLVPFSCNNYIPFARFLVNTYTTFFGEVCRVTDGPPGTNRIICSPDGVIGRSENRFYDRPDELGWEAADVAVDRVLTGLAGAWRTNATKILVLITDEAPGSCSPGRQAILQTANALSMPRLAQKAISCGIKFIIINPRPDQQIDFWRWGASTDTSILARFYKQPAVDTGGIYISTEVRYTNTDAFSGEFRVRGTLDRAVPKIKGFIATECGLNLPTTVDCLDSTNIVRNGRFITGIQQWSVDSPTVTHNPDAKAMRLSGTVSTPATVSQSYTGLNLGDTVKLTLVFNPLVAGNFSWSLNGLVNSIAVDLTKPRYILETVATIDATQQLQLILSTTGAVDLAAVNLELTASPICGPSGTNFINNPLLDARLDGWQDLDSNPVVTSPSTYDAALNAAILTASGLPVFKQPVSGLIPGQRYSLSFDLIGYDPDDVDILGFVVSISGLSRTITNKTPRTIRLAFTATASNTLEFGLTTPSGTARIGNIFICGADTTCPPGYNRLSNNAFVTGRGGWNGGTIRTGEIVAGITGIRRQYVGLEAGAELRVSVQSVSDEPLSIEIGSGEFIYTKLFTDGPGIKVFSAPVQLSVAEVRIKAFEQPVVIDNILVCSADSCPCDGTFSKYLSQLRFVGVPRRPVNFFRMFTRFTLRDTRGNTRTVDLAPTAQGSLLPKACEFYKQVGRGGANIFGEGLTNTQNIQVGDIVNLNATNWIWAVPDGNAGQNTLNITYPEVNFDETVEKVEIMYLANLALPTESVNTPTGCQEVETFGITPDGRADPLFLVTQVRAAIQQQQLPITLPTHNRGQAFTRKLGTTGRKFRWNDDGQFETDTLQAICNILGYPNLLSSTFLDFERSRRYPNGKGNFDTPQNDRHLRWVGGTFIQEPATPKYGKQWVASITCSRPCTGTGILDPVRPGPFVCSPDPAEQIEFVINYRNLAGLARSFSQRVNIGDLLTQRLPFASILPNRWDDVAGRGPGLRGQFARWESVVFEIDTLDGEGLDQCTPLSLEDALSDSRASFKKVQVRGRGSFISECVADVRVETVQDGLLTSEVQSIIIPSASGGLWILTIRLPDQLSDAIDVIVPYASGTDFIRTPASVLQSLIEAELGVGNIVVNGTGDISDPYLLAFTGDLAGLNIPLVEVDARNLTGSAEAYVVTLQNGTLNERQTIVQPAGTLNNLVVTFNGSDSIPIAYNASLDVRQAAIEGIPTIGAGNVSVTGLTTNRTVPYEGNMFVEFTGALAQVNVSQMQVNQPYSVFTNWNGGVGGNEIQRITVEAVAGTFRLALSDPDNPTDRFESAPIHRSASAASVEDALDQASFLNSTDLVVTKLAQSSDEISIWNVEFIGSFAARDIATLEIIDVNLQGGNAQVDLVTQGDTRNEIQNIILTDADAGFFRLLVTVGDVEFTTTNIVYNSTAEGLREVLLAHPSIGPSNLIVMSQPAEDPSETARFMITFINLGNVTGMEVVTSSLKCGPIFLNPVPDGPYGYPPESLCDISLGCLSGPLFGIPCDLPPTPQIGPCCDEFTITERANRARTLEFQRDLFDPRAQTTPASGAPRFKTVRDLLLLKGLRPDRFVVYARNFESGSLEPIDLGSVVQNRTSILAIHKDLDNTGRRAQIVRHLGSTREILPSR